MNCDKKQFVGLFYQKCIQTIGAATIHNAEFHSSGLWIRKQMRFNSWMFSMISREIFEFLSYFLAFKIRRKQKPFWLFEKKMFISFIFIYVIYAWRIGQLSPYNPLYGTLNYYHNSALTFVFIVCSKSTWSTGKFPFPPFDFSVSCVFYIKDFFPCYN